jgi:uncharacterized protein (DUF433 family)
MCYHFDMSVKQIAVQSDPEILGSKPVFVGTRVPVQTLLDYLETDHDLSDFLDDFPTVQRDQIISDDSDTWTNEDIKDITKLSMEYANKLYSESQG